MTYACASVETKQEQVAATNSNVDANNYDDDNYDD
jgi:hypothetical protein